MRRREGSIALVLALVALASGASASKHDHAPNAPTNLTVDDDTAPLAVTDDPAFGWRVNDVDQGEAQHAYEIVVSDAQRHVVMDTQQVRSDQQSYVHVPLLTSKLRADHVYTWTVRTWDRSGTPGPYAPPARFDVGLHDGDWRASWIRRPGAEHAANEDFSLFRTVIRPGASPVVRARVYATAGQQYELHVNGVRRAHGPSFSYPDEQYYETTDISGELHPGEPNVIGFVTHWTTPGQGRPASEPALRAQITIDHADGTRETVGTDHTWKTHTGGWIQGPPRNEEGDFVEHLDMRALPGGWDRVGFDDRAWERAQQLDATPFTHLYAARTHVVEARMAPVSVKRVAPDAYVADFGKIYAATPAVELRHSRGTRVVLVGGDELDADGRVSRTHGNQATDMSWMFDTRAGAQEIRPFGYLGFRYLEIDGTGERLTAAQVGIYARHASMPDERAASFSTSDATLNAVWALARHSALYDAQEQFLDTPTREKGQFLGDSFDVSQATMAAFGERALTAQALRDFARSQARYWPDGRVNAVYPNGDGKRDIPDATQTYVEWVWHAYMTSGDRAQLASLYPVAAKICDYVARAVDPTTNLVTELPGGGEDYLYGAVDWPPQMRYGYDMKTTARTMINVLAVDDFDRCAQMAHALGRPAAEAKRHEQRAGSLRDAIRAKLARADGVFADGLEANGRQSTHASQQANAWALAFGIVPREHERAVADYVVSLKNAMGVVYFRVLLDALHAAGRDDALVAALTDPARPGYAQLLKRGGTFTWESWDAPDVGDSESHGWGSTVLSVLQDDILGVRATAPGAATVDVDAPRTSVTRATGTVATQRGPVAITWQRDGSVETIDVTIPVNMTATVHLDGRKPTTIGSGRHVLTNTPRPRTHRSSSTAAAGVGVALAGALLALGVTLLHRRRRVA
jgi:alpha-L-rhamnosidase